MRKTAPTNNLSIPTEREAVRSPCGNRNYVCQTFRHLRVAETVAAPIENSSIALQSQVMIENAGTPCGYCKYIRQIRWCRPCQNLVGPP